MPEAYNDVTVGNNRCTVNYRACCPYGFNATRGWDPVVGIGTPYFPVFQRLVQPPLIVPIIQANDSDCSCDGCGRFVI